MKIKDLPKSDRSKEGLMTKRAENLKNSELLEVDANAARGSINGTNMKRIWNRRKINNSLKPKVFAALSGGVDSAVAALLLKESGYQVSGAFMDLWPGNKEKGEQARKVASALKIPFYVFNLHREFKERVVGPFLRAYQSGLTPNPCVDCNVKIKFDLFWQKAREKGAELMATGHYVRIKKIDNSFHLFRGIDRDKDQSYFLWGLNQRQLSRVIFPLGGYRKKEVKELAKKWGLPIGDGDESMEICFVSGSVNDFLKNNLKFSTGPILNDQGDLVGEHQGLPFYTIGQRKGIGFSGGQYYVCGKKIKKNTLLITADKRMLKSSGLYFKGANWISGGFKDFPIRVSARIRYRHRPVGAVLDQVRDGLYRARFDIKQSAVTPGQSVVFYHRSRLLGGGVIVDFK